MSIELNGQQVFVGENIWWALYHLRQNSQEIVLWVDAICIIQNDISERNHQVLKMETIYTNAEEVFVWLGRGRTSTG